MKILILGGTRFFGKSLTKLLLQEGHDVSVLTRGKVVDGLGPKLTRLQADRTKSNELKAAIKCDYDVVIDNICMNEQDAKTACDIFNGRIGHYVMTSTLSVYEAKADLVEADFDAANYIAKKPRHAGEEYQEGKRAAEAAFLLAPFSVSRMRIPIVLGEDDYTKRLWFHIDACQKGNAVFIPSPESHFSYVHAQDAALALSWMAHGKFNDVFNISSADHWSIGELIAQIEKSVGKQFVFGKEENPTSPYGIDQDYYVNVSKARALGFEARPLSQWLPELIQRMTTLPLGESL